MQSGITEEVLLELKEGTVKSYPEVLDAYSLHHILVRKGKVVEETPEFTSFKRIFQANWGAINTLFKEYEAIAAKFSLHLFSLDGKKV